MAIHDKHVNPVIRTWILAGVTLAAVSLSSCVNTSVYFEDLARKYAADADAMAARLQAQPSCCASFDGMRYEKAAKKFIQINPGAASPTFDFDEGRSRTKARVSESSPIEHHDQLTSAAMPVARSAG